METPVLALCFIGAAPLAGCDRLDSSLQAAPIKTATVEGKVHSRRTGGQEVRA